MSSAPDPHLEATFRNTRYRTEFGTIHVDQELPVGILQWMDDQKASALAVLGAENPRGVVASADANTHAHQRLLTELEVKGFSPLDALGTLDTWAEHHLVVLGIDIEDARSISRAFDQAAFLWCTREGTVELIWC